MVDLAGAPGDSRRTAAASIDRTTTGCRYRTTPQYSRPHYTAYLGHAQLAHATPTLAPRGEALQAYAAEAIRTLVDRGGGDDPPPE